MGLYWIQKRSSSANLRLRLLVFQQSQIHKICLILSSSALPWFHTGRVRISVVWLISLHHLQCKSLHHTYTISACHAQAFIGLLLTTHCIFPHEVTKCSQLGLVLNCFKFDDAYCFQLNLHVSPSTFNTLLTLVENHLVFYNSSHQDQMPIECQLAIALYQFGHFGNAASVELVAQWAGCSAGSVVNATHQVIRAFLPLHDQAIHWPNAEEKQEASDWIESVSCHAWHLGSCMVDGTLIPLHSKPRHYGKQFFDHKSNYSLSLMVCFSPCFNFLYLCYS